MIAPLASDQPRDTSVPTGAPIGGVTTLPGRNNAGLTKYDKAIQQIRPMDPAEQTAFALGYKGAASTPVLQQQSIDAAAQDRDEDPNSPQNVKQRDLDIEHPSAFAPLRSGGRKRKFATPRQPGPMRR